MKTNCLKRKCKLWTKRSTREVRKKEERGEAVGGTSPYTLTGQMQKIPKSELGSSQGHGAGGIQGSS